MPSQLDNCCGTVFYLNFFFRCLKEKNAWAKGGSCYLEDMHSVFNMDDLAYRFGVPCPFFNYALVVGGGGG